MGYEMGNQNTNGLQVSEQDTNEVTKATNEPSEMSKYVDNLKVSEEGEYYEINTNKSHGLSVSVVNDAKEKCQSTEIHFSFDPVLEKGEHNDINTNRSHVVSDAEEKSQSTEIKEEVKAAVLDKPPENSKVLFESVDPESNEQKPVAEIYQESAAKSIKEEIKFQGEGMSTESGVEEMSIESGVEENMEEEKEQIRFHGEEEKEQIRFQGGLSTERGVEENMEEEKEQIRFQGEGMPIESGVEENMEEENEQDNASDHSNTEFTPSHQKNVMLSNPINSNYLDAVDSEIKRPLENDEKIISLEQEYNREDGGSEYSLTNLLQIDEITATEDRQQEQHVRNPSSTFKESPTKDVEINTRENHSEIINLKQEEEHKREYGGSKDLLTELLQTDEITAAENRHQEQHDSNPSSTSEESNTEKECKEILENGCNISPDDMLGEEKEDEEKIDYKSDWKNNEETSQINEEQWYSLTSSLSEPTVALSEQPGNEFASQIIEVPRATMSEEQLHQTNIIEKGRADSSEPSESNVDLICSPEFEPKKNSEETETTARKDELVTESNDSGEYLNIYSGLLNLANEKFVSESEPENRKDLQGQTSPPVNEKFTQATEVSEVERILDSAEQNQNTKQQCPTMSLADKSSERCGLPITESNHEKQNIGTGGTRATDNLEKQIVEIGASATQSQKEDSGDSPLLVYEFERCVPEAEAQPPNNINVEAERGKQKPSPDHELTDDVFAYEIAVIVPESTNEETDKSPLLHKESSGSSGLERTKSRKLKAPIESCLEDAYVLDSFEKNEGLSLTKTTGEVRVLTVERNSNQREKQKSRSSLFSNCMCCTTAIN